MKIAITSTLLILAASIANAAPSCPSFVTQGRILPSTVNGACGICEYTCAGPTCFQAMYSATVDGAELTQFRGAITNTLQGAQANLAQAIGEGQCGRVTVE